MSLSKSVLVALMHTINSQVSPQGTIFDVTGNKAYGPEGSYKGSHILKPLN